MMLEGDLKDTLQSGKKKEEAPICNFEINIVLTVRQCMTDLLWWISVDFQHLP